MWRQRLLEWNIEVTEKTWSGLIRCSPLPTEGASLSIGLHRHPTPLIWKRPPAIMHSSAVHLQLWSCFSRKIYCLFRILVLAVSMRKKYLIVRSCRMGAVPCW
ncbi:hypothetical protein CDAR_35291 [Caerostris darwini]|uniref:Uncharacterized protein n=1 Tax=Caerostris darwini TaxID=1538125 RepID=A0AAV4SJU3_9ARAC|nr:hypothetical protein CDAR_35291 [Caerostris darwini]